MQKNFFSPLHVVPLPYHRFSRYYQDLDSAQLQEFATKVHALGPFLLLWDKNFLFTSMRARARCPLRLKVSSFIASRSFCTIGIIYAKVFPLPGDFKHFYALRCVYLYWRHT
jgi:hypothetical protein